MTVQHNSLTGTAIHVVHSFTYADSAARTGAAGLVAGDVGKVAWQTDDDTFWVLKDDSPVTWASLGSGAVAESAITFTDITTNNASTTKHGFLKKLSNAAGEFLNGLGNYVVPTNRVDIIPASPTAYDDEFEAGSLDGKWTEINSNASSTYSFSNSCINMVSTDRNPSRLWGFHQAVPSGNWTFVMKVTNNSPSASATYAGAWLFLRNSSNSRLLCGGLNQFNTVSSHVQYLSRLTNPTTLSADVASTTHFQYSTAYIKMAYDGTNITWSFSRDGVQYDEVALTEAKSTFITSFDQIGFGVMPYGVRSRFSVDYIRRIA